MTATGGAPTLLYRLYRGATWLAAPLAYHLLTRKLRKAGVDRHRLPERAGMASQQRPTGPLVWFHAASVGESLAVLTLLKALARRRPDLSFLITSGTATSAEMIAKRLPPRTQHQFAPLDAPGPVGRFLKYWHPDAGIFVESELWPNMLMQAKAAGMKLALVNARLSAKSVEGWTKWPETARLVMSCFDVMITQNWENRDNLLAMGADPQNVQQGLNLKSFAAPLPVDQDALKELKGALGARPIWVASSTHPGEEETVLAAHKALLSRYADLLLILVPRHPDRGSNVLEMCRDTGLKTAQRSVGDLISTDTQVYLADTLGETGTWYAAAPIVFMGGSLKPIGGHNPFEPAQTDTAILTGPHVANFSETYPSLIGLGGAIETGTAKEIETAVAHWLESAPALETARDASRQFVDRQARGLDDVIDRLSQALGLDADHVA